MTYLEALLTFPPGTIVTDKPHFRRPVRHFKVIEVREVGPGFYSLTPHPNGSKRPIWVPSGPTIIAVKLHNKSRRKYDFKPHELTIIKASNTQ
jgi:hypothetical protein